MRKRWICLAVMVLFVLSDLKALAVFSPGLTAFDAAYQGDETLSLEATAQVKSWKALSKDSLPTLSELLEDTSIYLDFSNQAEILRLERSGKTIFSLAQIKDRDKSALYLPAANVGFESPPGTEPIQMLLGQPQTIHLLGSLTQIDLDSLADLPQSAVDILAPYGQTQQRRTNIKSLGTSLSFVQYKLTAAQWQMVWPFVLESLKSLVPEELRAASEALDGLKFEKPVTLKRYLDKAGSPMGWGFSSSVLLSPGDERTLSLILGCTPKEGLSLVLKAPAARGKNNAALDVSYALQEQSFSGKLRYENRLDGKNYLLKGDASFKNELSEEGEHLRGTLWLEEKPAGETASRLTLKPDIHFEGERAKGVLHVLQEKGGKAVLDVNFNLVLSAGSLMRLPAVETMFLLDTHLAPAKAALSEAMLRLTRDILMSLPLPQRKLLLHDMGRTLRTQGDVLPALTEKTPDYLVIEDTKKEVFP
ncbi:MAG: hypothetical protein GX781_03650 [Clostridiales bacterium]|nr:hypothetical protein [Clostridiales bacterium]